MSPAAARAARRRLFQAGQRPAGAAAGEARPAVDGHDPGHRPRHQGRNATRPAATPTCSSTCSCSAPAPAADSEARLAELRRHGVEHNAHTDHDLMTFEVSCPAAESAWALEQMRQHRFFRPPRPAAAGEREAHHRRGDPAAARRPGAAWGACWSWSSCSPATPTAGRSTATAAPSARPRSRQLQAFYAPRLVPERCALAVIGDFTLADMEKEVRRGWGAMPRGGMAATGRSRRRTPGEEQRAAASSWTSSESHLFIAWRAPDFNDRPAPALQPADPYPRARPEPRPGLRPARRPPAGRAGGHELPAHAPAAAWPCCT